jgi:hypothetical protein
MLMRNLAVEPLVAFYQVLDLQRRLPREVALTHAIGALRQADASRAALGLADPLAIAEVFDVLAGCLRSEGRARSVEDVTPEEPPADLATLGRYLLDVAHARAPARATRLAWACVDPVARVWRTVERLPEGAETAAAALLAHIGSWSAEVPQIDGIESCSEPDMRDWLTSVARTAVPVPGDWRRYGEALVGLIGDRVNYDLRALIQSVDRGANPGSDSSREA